MSGDVQRRIDEEVDELAALLQPGREEDLKTFLLLLHPADVADLIAEIDPATTVEILKRLEADRAAWLLSVLEPNLQARLLPLLQPQHLARIVSEMESDDLADLLQSLPQETARDVLNRLPLEEREEVTELLGYDPESAGGIMQTELVSVRADQTIADALSAVRDRAEDIDIMSVFVVDDKKRYLGNLALQTLIFNKADKPVIDVMEPKVVDVSTDVDQEEVARIFEHYGLVELGVVDRVGRLRGRVTADDIHDVLIEEHGEDMMLLAGAGPEPEAIYSKNVFKITVTRLPWLLATFLGGLTATYILESAKPVFQTMIVLLMFVPVITGMSGNVGTQSAMIMIQGLASGHILDSDLRVSVARDGAVGALIATTCGIAIFAVILIWQNNFMLAACVSLSLGVSVTAAAILGSAEPLLLRRLGIDPAIAAGPLITSINDITGVAIYALIAREFIAHFG